MTVVVRSGAPLLSDDELAEIDAALSPPPGCIPFASRARRMPWFDRVDPFSLGFGASLQYTWHAYSKSAWTRVLGPRGPKWSYTCVYDFEPLSERTVSAVGGPVERIVAALTSWRVLTSQQVSCFTQIEQKKANETLSKILRAGLVERGRMVSHFEGVSTPAMYRLRKGRELDRYLERIGEERKATILLGQEAGAAGHERHDLLGAEIALRAAETVSGLQGALGERSAAAKDLLGAASGARGDVVLVRRDGLRIVVEVTTQPRIEDVMKKMSRWGRLLAEFGGITKTGLVVVFVAANYDGAHGRLEALKKNFDKAMTAQALGSMGQPAPVSHVHTARSSVFVASCEEWFPAAWFISERFSRLSVHFSVVPGEWGEVALAEESDGGVAFRPGPGVDWGHLAKVRHKLYGVPPFSGGPLISFAAT